MTAHAISSKFAELRSRRTRDRPAGSEVSAGDVVQIGNARLTVKAVGDAANANLEALGHVTLRLADPDPGSGPLPGEITLVGSLPAEVHPSLSIQTLGGA